MAECYTATIKSERAASAKKLNECKKSYLALKDKETVYAKDVHAYMMLLEQVHEIYHVAPKEL